MASTNTHNGDRTRGHSLKRRTLYRLSYVGKGCFSPLSHRIDEHKTVDFRIGLEINTNNHTRFRVSDEKKCAFKSHPWRVNLEINAVDMMYTSYSVT